MPSRFRSGLPRRVKILSRIRNRCYFSAERRLQPSDLSRPIPRPIRLPLWNVLGEPPHLPYQAP